MAGFNYGWDDDLNAQTPTFDPNNPYGSGGAIGSQPGSQTGGQGAGITSPDMPAPPDPAAGAGASGSTSATAPTAPAAPATPAAPVTAGGTTDQQTPDYSAQMQNIQNATDPQQAALAHDQLARSLYSSLSEQGHDVKWDGDNLIVDGRPYVVGGGATWGAGPVAKMGMDGTTAAAPQSPPTGDQADQWIRFTNELAGYGGEGGAFDASLGRTGASEAAGAARGHLQAIVDQYNQRFGGQARVVSDDRVDFGDGRGPVDVIRDAGGGQSGFWYGAGGGGAPGGGSTPGTGGGSPLPGGGIGFGGAASWDMPTAAPVAAPTMTSQYDEMLNTAMNRQGDFSVPDVSMGQLPSDLAGWRPGGGPQYTPGEIGTGDIPDFTYGSLMGDMTKGTEGYDALMQQLLANPESLDARTVDTMKAQMRNTIAEQQQQEEEDLKGFGAQAGISDSNWLASQRAGSRRARDMGVAAGAQNIDIEAAKTRMGDKRAAAELGTKWAGQKTANVQAAADASLKRAAVTGDWLQLREQVKQEAARLGIQADTVMNDFIGKQQDNLLKKYGIDLGAAVDMKKLGEQSQEFKEGLVAKMAELERTLSMQKYGIDTTASTSKYGTDVGAMTSKYGADLRAATDKYSTDVGASTSRYGVDVSAGTSEAARRQQDEQFAASLGLDYEQLNRLRNQDEWTRFTDMYGKAK